MSQALRSNVTGKIQRRESELSVFDKHGLRIARDSMKMPCAMLGVMGGPNHFEAAHIIHELTGAIVGIDSKCTCPRTSDPRYNA